MGVAGTAGVGTGTTVGSGVPPVTNPNQNWRQFTGPQSGPGTTTPTSQTPPQQPTALVTSPYPNPTNSPQMGPIPQGDLTTNNPQPGPPPGIGGNINPLGNPSQGPLGNPSQNPLGVRPTQQPPQWSPRPGWNATK